MDLRQYYQNIRETEKSINHPYPVVASQKTGDGGKSGVLTEVTRQIAAKMLVDGTAQLAKAEDAEAFRKQQAAAQKQAQQAAEAAKIQIALMAPESFLQLRGVEPTKETSSPTKSSRNQKE
jgi:hypothetical protein